MIIECNYCESRVDAKEIASHESYDSDTDPAPFLATLLECPNCHNTLLAGQYQEGEGEAQWDQPSRVWPAPDRYISWEIPPIVRLSLEEAERCFKAQAYTAAAVMSGRALEGICRHHKTKSTYLSGGLQELAKSKVIDGRLLEWSKALREQRNLAAHATTHRLGKEDARDVLDFVHAICDYVFVLNTKYVRFKARQAAAARTESSKSKAEPKAET